MREDIIGYLRCPVCRQALHPAPGGLRCPQGHQHDAARQGYVDLTGGTVTHPGDTAAMVADRATFLAGGHFDVLATALATAAGAAVPDRAGLVLDAGAGTGWYLAAVLNHRPSSLGLALDVAKPALRRAARAHPRAGAARADLWRGVPVQDRVCDLILNVFAPRNGAEFARVLRPDGRLLVVTPDPAHLAGLVDEVGLLRVAADKADRLAGTLDRYFTPDGATSHRAELSLRHAEVAAVVGMGPSAWHADPDQVARRIAALPEPTTVTAAVRVTRYRPR